MAFTQRVIAAVQAFRNPPQRHASEPALPGDDDDYETFMDHRNQLTQLEWDQGKSFDQAMITLSGGALVLSITFIDQLASDPEYLYLLYPAWIGLALAPLLILLSFHFSQLAAMHARTIEDEHYRNGDRSAKRPPNRWSRWIRWCRYLSIAAFIVGICSLGLFTIWNLE